MPKVKVDDAVIADVEQALVDCGGDLAVVPFFDELKETHPDALDGLTARQFNARYVLRVKRQMKNGGEKKETLPKEPSEAPATNLRNIALRDLVPWPKLNPREIFSSVSIDRLAKSIEESGILQPLGVKLNDHPPHWIFAGERRYRAAHEAGVEFVPCAIQDITEAEAHALALVENLQRSDLTAIEEARGIRRYMDANAGVTQTEVGEILGGYGQAWVSNRLRLLQLPVPLQELVQYSTISPTSARDHLLPFTKLRDEDARAQVFDAVRNAIAAEQEKLQAFPLEDDQVRKLAGSAAAEVSFPVVVHAGKQEHVGDTWKRVYVTEEMHEECGCGGPTLKYKWHARTRCFDPAWWRDRQNAAASKAKEAAEKGSDDTEEEEPTPIDELVEKFDWPDRTEPVPLRRFQEAFNWDVEFLWSSDLLPTAELLPADRIYLVQNGGDVIIGVAGKTAVEEARARTHERVDQEVRLRQRKRGEADLEAVSEHSLDHDRILLLAVELAHPMGLIRILEDLGLDTPEDWREGRDVPGRGDILRFLQGLPWDTAEKALLVLAHRYETEAPNLGWDDPLSAAVVNDLTAELEAGLREIVPGGRLPWDPEPEEEPEAPEIGDVVKELTPDQPAAGVIIEIKGSIIGVSFADPPGDLGGKCPVQQMRWEPDGFWTVSHFVPVKGFEHLLEEARAGGES